MCIDHGGEKRSTVGSTGLAWDQSDLTSHISGSNVSITGDPQPTRYLYLHFPTVLCWGDVWSRIGFRFHVLDPCSIMCLRVCVQIPSRWGLESRMLTGSNVRKAPGKKGSDSTSRRRRKK